MVIRGWCARTCSLCGTRCWPCRSIIGSSSSSAGAEGAPCASPCPLCSPISARRNRNARSPPCCHWCQRDRHPTSECASTAEPSVNNVSTLTPLSLACLCVFPASTSMSIYFTASRALPRYLSWVRIWCRIWTNKRRANVFRITPKTRAQFLIISQEGVKHTHIHFIPSS